ncbi:MAG: hypothetical protein Q7S96_02640 [bacterium]|nr:hypothetical protein [bacterium]
MGERFLPQHLDSEAKRTQTAGLPLFEWARSERVRKEGKEAIASEIAHDEPDYRYIADTAAILAERVPMMHAEESGTIPEQGVEPAETRTVREDIRALVGDEDWQYYASHFQQGFYGPLDDIAAAALRTIDPERFDREVSPNDRERLWDAARHDLDDRVGMSPGVRIATLQRLWQLDSDRFMREVNADGKEFDDARDAIGAVLANERPSYILSCLATAKRIFGPEVLAPHEETIRARWGEWMNNAQRIYQSHAPEGIWQMALLQQIAPEGHERPHPSRAAWERAREDLSHRPAASSMVDLIHLMTLVDLEFGE